MTRRKVIQRLIKAISSIVIGVTWLDRNKSPRRFIHALGVKKYPGPVKLLKDISKLSKWSG